MKNLLILSALAVVIVGLILLRIFTGGGAKSGPAAPAKQPAVPVEGYVVHENPAMNPPDVTVTLTPLRSAIVLYLCIKQF